MFVFFYLDRLQASHEETVFPSGDKIKRAVGVCGPNTTFIHTLVYIHALAQMAKTNEA